jgi:SAM-dependent methyltransferase
VGEYVLDHHLEGERSRLALMSRLLDPMHRRHIESLGVGPGARVLEVGCGNGSISAWLAERVGPRGRAVALDLDLSLVDVRAPGLELREGDIVAGPVDPGGFDLVTRGRCCTTSRMSRRRFGTSPPAWRQGARSC